MNNIGVGQKYAYDNEESYQVIPVNSVDDFLKLMGGNNQEPMKSTTKNRRYNNTKNKEKER
jgi:hypothetical protein